MKQSAYTVARVIKELNKDSSCCFDDSDDVLQIAYRFSEALHLTGADEVEFIKMVFGASEVPNV